MNYIVGVNLRLKTENRPKDELVQENLISALKRTHGQVQTGLGSPRLSVPTLHWASWWVGISFPALESIWFICQKGIHLAAWVWLAKVARVRARAQARGGAPSNPSAPNRLAWSCVRRPEPAQVLVTDELGFTAATHMTPNVQESGQSN